MKELDIHVIDIWLDQNTRDEDQHIQLKNNGPLISRVLEGTGKLEPGSLLFGEFKITGAIGAAHGSTLATVRYTLAQLPDGKKYPVCMEGKTQGKYAQGSLETSAAASVIPVNEDNHNVWITHW